MKKLALLAAALVALAEANVKAGPTDRSQVFLAVTAEESGLLGSAYYGENPVFPFSRTVGGVNMDALSVAGLAKNVVVIGKGKSQLDAYLDRALAAQGRVATVEPTPSGFIASGGLVMAGTLLSTAPPPAAAPPGSAPPGW